MKNFRPFSSATRLLFCAICLALLSPSPASAQSADDYLKQAKKAEYESKEQFDLYMKAAELGNAEAQYWVGLRYDIGSGVAEDNYEAFKWYKKSADQGYAEGIYRVGEAYMFGIGVQKDYKMAEKYYLSAAYKGYGEAYFKLGLLYKTDLENKNEAIYWYKKYVDYFYAEYGELCPASLESLRELGVYYHPDEKSSNSSQTQSQAQTQTQTQQVYTPEYGVRDVWVNCLIVMVLDSVHTVKALAGVIILVTESIMVHTSALFVTAQDVVHIAMARVDIMKNSNIRYDRYFSNK